MLILAGVSLNAVIGDNGIITQAQNATYMQSVAVLEEFMQQEYLKLYGKLDNPENKIDYFINDTSGSRNYIQKAMNNNYYFMDNVSGNTYYFIEKSALPDEIRNQIKGGDTSLSNKTIWADFTDIYGITSDLKVYYCSNSSDTRIGATDENLQADLSKPIAGMSAGSDWANALGIDRDVTYRDLLSVSDLTITNSNLDLNLMYNLGSLKKLTFKDVEMQNLDGIGNASNLEYIYFNNSRVNNYKGIEDCSKLKYLYLYLPPSMSEEDANRQVKNLCDENIGIANADLTNLQYFGIFGVDTYNNNTSNWSNISKTNVYSKLNNISDLSKLKSSKYIEYIFLYNTQIKTILMLENFVNLKQAVLCNNNLESLDGLENKTLLMNVYAQYCSLNNIEGLSGCTKLSTLCVYGNTNLQSLSGIENSNSIEYIYANDCALGINEDAEVSSNTDALYDLKDKTSLSYCDISFNDIKRVEYLSSSIGIEELYLDGNNNLNGDSLLAIKDRLIQCGNKSSVPSKFSLFLLDENTKNLSLKEQTLNKDNFILIKSKTQLTKLDLSSLKLVDNSDNELSTEETNELINEVLSTLTGIQYLNLSDIEKLNTITFVKQMKNLTELVLFGTNVRTVEENESGEIVYGKDSDGNYTGLELLNNNENLKGLGLDNEKIELSKITPALNRMPLQYTYYTESFLRQMGLTARNSKMFNSLNNNSTGLENLSLSNLTIQEEVDLSNCTTLQKVAFIYGSDNILKLPNSVTYLYIDGPRLKGNYPSQLEEASFVNSALADDILINLSNNCSNLKKIYSSNSHGVSNLKYLENAKFKNTLEVLSLKRNSIRAGKDEPGVESLEGIENFSKLNTISINKGRINSLEPLKNIETLTSISFEDNKIYSLHGLENLKNLQSINLENNCLQDIIQYTDETGNIKNVRNLSIIANLHSNNGGVLKSVFLKDNSNLTDFSLIENLSWTEKSGF